MTVSRPFSIFAGVAVLMIIFIFMNQFAYQLEPQGSEPNRELSFFTVSARFDIDIMEGKLLEKGYESCGNYVLREGINYIKFEYNSPGPIACYFKVKREHKNLAILFSIKHFDAWGPFKGTELQTIASDWLIELINIPDPFSRFIRENISGTSVPGGRASDTQRPIGMIDTLYFFSYKAENPNKSYVSLQLTLVVADVNNIPSWFKTFLPGVYRERWMRGDWRGYLNLHYFFEECGTYDINPSKNSFTFTYKVKPSGAMCYFTLNVPQNTKVIPERTVLKLQTNKPVNVTGKAFVVFDSAVVSPKQIVHAKFSDRAVGFGRDLQDQFVKDLLAGKPIHLGLRKHVEVGDAPIIVPLIIAIAANSELSEIPEIDVEFTMLYSTR